MKDIYKRWWFWVLILIGIVILMMYIKVDSDPIYPTGEVRKINLFEKYILPILEKIIPISSI